MGSQMSFRTEDKFYLNFQDKIKINKFFLDNGIKKLYPDRKILSLYFDTSELSMFNDSEEGVVPRKKIRIRQYNKNKFEIDDKSSIFELKITAVEGKFKISKNILLNQNIIKNGYFDKDYGVCFPFIFTSYNRSYYSFEKNRFTIDSNIRFKDFKNKSNIFKTFDRQIILEIKSNEQNYNQILSDIPLNRIRYSKFCEGVKYLNLD